MENEVCTTEGRKCLLLRVDDDEDGDGDTDCRRGTIWQKLFRPLVWAHFISGQVQASMLFLTVYRQANCGLLGVTQINSGGCRIQIPAAWLEPRERELGTELQGKLALSRIQEVIKCPHQGLSWYFSMFLAAVPSDIGRLAQGKTREQE